MGVQTISWIRRFSVWVKRALQLAAMAAGFSGCDVFNKETDFPVAVAIQPENSVTSETAAAESVSLDSGPSEAGKISLVAGQTEAEVCQLLGQPSGKISSSNRTCFLYSGEALEFIDGRLIASVPDIQERIEAKKRIVAQQVAEESDKTEAKSGIKRACDKIAAMIPDWGQKRAKQIVLTDERGREIDHSQLLVSGKITVVDFYATWCGPCKQMAPILEEMVRGQQDVVLRKVDIGNWGSETASRYDIYSVPNVRVFDKQGRLVAQPSSNPNEISGNIKIARKQP